MTDLDELEATLEHHAQILAQLTQSNLASLLSLEFVDGLEDEWEMYVGNDGDWWWRKIWAGAGEEKITLASTEGYRNREDCVANMKRSGYSPLLSLVRGSEHPLISTRK